MLEAGLKQLYETIQSIPEARDLEAFGAVMHDLKSLGTLKKDLKALSLNDLAKYAASEDDSQQLGIAGSSLDPKQGDEAYEDELAVVKGIMGNGAAVNALLKSLSEESLKAVAESAHQAMLAARQRLTRAIEEKAALHKQKHPPEVIDIESNH